MTVRPSLRGAAKAAAVLGMVCFLYVTAAVTGALIPVNGDFREPDGGIPIYLISNGIHVDVLLPIRSGAGDWRNFLVMDDFTAADARANYLAFGWGDRAIFIDTPGWGDLTVTTAAKALLGLNGTVMHVDPHFIDGAAPLPEGMVRVRISLVQLHSLTGYLQAGFLRDNGGGKPQKIASAGLWGSDVFYPATGRYSPLLTCNEWLRRGLAQAGIRMPLWSPFAPGVLYQAGRSGGPLTP